MPQLNVLFTALDEGESDIVRVGERVERGFGVEEGKGGSQEGEREGS